MAIKELSEILIIMVSVIGLIRVSVFIGNKFGSFENFVLAILSKIRNRLNQLK